MFPCGAVSDDILRFVSCCDQDGWSALLVACVRGRLDVARWLVTDAGSDARSERHNVSCRCSCGCLRVSFLYREPLLRALGWCVIRMAVQPFWLHVRRVTLMLYDGL
jgi:hypothetical protein